MLMHDKYLLCWKFIIKDVIFLKKVIFLKEIQIHPRRTFLDIFWSKGSSLKDKNLGYKTNADLISKTFFMRYKCCWKNIYFISMECERLYVF